MIEILNDKIFTKKWWEKSCSIINVIIFCICAIILLISIISTVFIIIQDDSIDTQNTKGDEVTPIDIEDLTSENYFNNFSLLVLTSLSLPVDKGFYSLSLYIFVVLAFGIVYVKKGLIYMNPVLTLLDFNTYRCIDETSKDKFIFVVRNFELQKGTNIKFKTTSKKIIRLNNKKEKNE